MRHLGPQDGDIGEKPVSPSSDGLDEAGALRGIAQRVPELADRLVEAVIEVDGRPRPQQAVQLLPRDQLPRPLEQDDQEPEGLLLQPKAPALLQELPGSGIGLEHPEPEAPGRLVGLLHRVLRADRGSPPSRG